MELEKLFELAAHYLERNDFGVAHTKRVFELAKGNFCIPDDLKELTLTTIILHDIGGSTVREQYEIGPGIAEDILFHFSYQKDFIRKVRNVIGTHHEHPENPPLNFRILYDSDRLAMLSPEEFPYYNSKPNFDWESVINSMYTEHARDLARTMLLERKIPAA